MEKGAEIGVFYPEEGDRKGLRGLTYGGVEG